MEEKTTILGNAYFISVLNVLENCLSKIPRPAHVNTNSESRNIYQYFFTQPKRKDDKEKMRGRIAVDYSRTTIRPDGSIKYIGEDYMNDQIVFECNQIQQGTTNTVQVSGQYPTLYSSTEWIKSIFDNIWAELLEKFPVARDKQTEYEIVGHIDAKSVTLKDVAETLKNFTEWAGISASPQIALAKIKKPRQQRGAQLETENSLKRLREIRLDAIKNNRSIPTKAAAMDEAGITDKTWKKYDQELWARWDDISYKQEKRE